MLPKQTDNALGEKMCQIDGIRRIAENFERNMPDCLAAQFQRNQPIDNQGGGRTEEYKITIFRVAATRERQDTSANNRQRSQYFRQDATRQRQRGYDKAVNEFEHQRVCVKFRGIALGFYNKPYDAQRRYDRYCHKQ